MSQATGRASEEINYVICGSGIGKRHVQDEDHTFFLRDTEEIKACVWRREWRRERAEGVAEGGAEGGAGGAETEGEDCRGQGDASVAFPQNGTCFLLPAYHHI